MKIKSLSLHGFKSFADRTDIDFHAGITAIVGPNGCGKSNISDALRWVLGEQRPSAIRGSRMEEAIFQGTSQRRPIHRAEVSLRLTNEDGILSVPYNEVAIGRTVLRGGESDYLLNGASCRLKDIHDLCRDTGLGANAYSIIEARMIDAILSDRAEERRSLFEEAAEVGRYKDRRRTALRRLDQAEHDLARLEDVLGEVRSKVRSLGRQRGRARRYEEFRERRLQLEVAVADERLRATELRLDEVETRLQELRRHQPEEEARLRQMETEAETLRLHIVERERERSDVASELEQTRSRAEELERRRLLAGERVAAAESRIETIVQEIEDIAGRRGALADEVERLRAEIEAADAELEERRELGRALEERAEEARRRRLEVESREREALEVVAEVIRDTAALDAESEAARARAEQRRRELEARRSDLGEALRVETEQEEAAAARAEEARAAVERHERLEAELAEARAEEGARREELRKLQDRMAGLEAELSSTGAVASGLASLLAEGRDLPPVVSDLVSSLGEADGVLGILADMIEAPRDVRPAVESHLGPLLHAVLVRDWHAVRRVRDWLADRGTEDGVSVLPVDPGPVERTDSGADGLAARVTARSPAEGWVRALLGAVEVQDVERLTHRDRPWVAADGTGQDSRGVVRLGRPTAGAGTLRRRGELAELEARLESLRGDLASARAERASAEDVAQAQRATVARVEAEVAEATDARRRAESERESSRGRLERTRTTVEEIRSRVEELERLVATEGTGPPQDDERRVRLEESRARAEETLAEERAGRVSATSEWERENAVLQELLLEVARAEAALESKRERAERAVERDGELAARRRELEREMEERRAAIDGSRATAAAAEEELVGLLERRTELAGRVRAAQEGLDERRAELEERETALRAERQSERQLAELRHAAELEVAQLRAQRANTRERLEAEWEASFEELQSRVEPPEEGDPESWASELEAVRAKLSSLGPVNLLAAQEYDEESGRLSFLEEQRDDLERARRDLHDSIRRINEAASAAFSHVFEEVRTNFRDIFITLFEGGEADVWLADPEDPLDSPIEISASPRGKKTQRIHLLSGGERALTALALVFAIYLTKPSPFCVMDEVDAPLDETNIGRFTAMLERFKGDTQFIVITHNARTIEAADWIYGVTMQEPGVSTLVGVELQDLPRGQVA